MKSNSYDSKYATEDLDKIFARSTYDKHEEPIEDAVPEDFEEGAHEKTAEELFEDRCESKGATAARRKNHMRAHAADNEARLKDKELSAKAKADRRAKPKTKAEAEKKASNAKKAKREADPKRNRRGKLDQLSANSAANPEE